MTRQLALAITAVAGLFAMGADPLLPVPPAPSAERLAKMFPTPRLFEITNSMDGKANGTSQFCLNADTISRQLDSLRGLASDPKIDEGCTRTVDHRPDGAVHVERACGKGSSLLGPGCTQTIDRKADGAVHIEMRCDKTSGGSRTMHTTMDADGHMKEMRQHMELELDVGQPPRTLVSDSHIVQAGPCPADLKPGEMRMPDGTKLDATKMFSALGKAGDGKSAH